METNAAGVPTSLPRLNISVVAYSRVGLFLVVLFMAVVSLVVDSPFQSEKISLTLLIVSFLGLSLQFLKAVFNLQSKTYAFVANAISSLLICALFMGLQSAQSLFLLLLLVNVLLYGLEEGILPATNLALVTSAFYSVVIIFNSGFSHFQDLLSLGLFNMAIFFVAALSGEYSERLTKTEKAFEKSQDLLQDLKSRHRVLIQELPMGLVVWNQQGIIVEQNPFFVEQFLSLVNWKNFYDSEMKSHISKSYFQMEKNLGDKQFVFRNRSLQSGDENYTLTLIEDVTETRRLENDLKQKEKMAAVGTLAAGIAHEIRNPLAGMSGSIELLSVKPNTEEDQKLFKIILREIERLNRLIGEFLDYSKPEMPVQDVIQVQPILEGVLGFIQSSQDKPVGLVIEKKIETTKNILGSSDKLRQAFLNIVINALHAMQKTSQPLLKVEVKQHDDSSIKVVIQDNGCGMNEVTRQKMFEPFHTTKPKGTGLGLAVTHKILDVHHAQISVKSELGQGTEFILIFPCA